MGNKRSGRKPKPTEMKVLEGTFRKDRHGKAPLISGKFPEPPAHLVEAERIAWQTFPKAPWILEPDAAAVEGAVSIYASLIALRMGDVRQYEAEARLWGRLLPYLAALGLTPADRTKMSIPNADDTEETTWRTLLG